MTLREFLESLNYCDEPAPRRVVNCCLITHVLSTAVDYILHLNRVWSVPGIVAIPYSVEPPAVATLRAAGLRVEAPTSLAEVPELGLKLVQDACAGGATTIVQEVGGYLAPYVAHLAELPGLLGIVEDTAQGHWRYEAVESGQLPIVSIAQSPLKAIEDTLIGDAVVYSLERIMREEFRDVLQGKSCLVLGYGRIGQSCAVALRGREGHVAIYDSDSAAMLRARVEGYKTGELEELLCGADIVVGATGRTSLGAGCAHAIKPGAVLASASSRDIEFDLQGLRPYLRWNKGSLVSVYKGPAQNAFALLNEGRPINFRDASILGPYLFLVYGALYYSMLKLAAGHVRPGLTTLSAADNHLIASVFNESLAGMHPAELDEELSSAANVAAGSWGTSE